MVYDAPNGRIRAMLRNIPECIIEVARFAYNARLRREMWRAPAGAYWIWMGK